MKEVVVSGIRSTGNLHLGNYYGALRNFVKRMGVNKRMASTNENISTESCKGKSRYWTILSISSSQERV